jgi:hypothetical protein
VEINGKNSSFIVQSYTLSYDTKVKTNGWQYAVLTDNETASGNEEQTVDSINFDMDFAPNEEYEVIVSYHYRLGGYPDYDDNAKNGEIQYYLAPASIWKDFSGLTINLYLDEDMLTNPTVQAHITEGTARITGMGSTDEAKQIASLIKSGALPVTIKPVNTRTIGPSLGSDALQRSVLAGAIGILIVLLFMLLYYRLPGFVADMALIVFILITLAIFIAFNVLYSSITAIVIYIAYRKSDFAFMSPKKYKKAMLIYEKNNELKVILVQLEKKNADISPDKAIDKGIEALKSIR